MVLNRFYRGKYIFKFSLFKILCLATELSFPSFSLTVLIETHCNIKGVTFITALLPQHQFSTQSEFKVCLMMVLY